LVGKVVLRRFIKYTLVLVFLLPLGFLAAVYGGLFGALPSQDELANIRQQQASLVYSTDARLIGKFFAQNRTNIAFEDFPEVLVQALVATEDARFWEHDGVDLRATARVLVKSVLLGDRSGGGGSTLSQQLAKNLYGRKSYGRLSMPVAKTREIIIARRLEAIYSKTELLELYLNTVPFGEDVFGVEAAAMRFFGQPASKLTVVQAATLVGLLKANTAYNPRLYPEKALERRNVVLRQMEKAGYLTAEARMKAGDQPIGLTYTHPETDGPAAYFLIVVRQEANRLLDSINAATGSDWQVERDGLRIRTSLHAGLQEAALAAQKKHLQRMQELLNQQYRSGASARNLQTYAVQELKRAGIAADQKAPRTLFTWSGVKSSEITALDSAKHSLQLLHAGMLALDPRTGAIRLWSGGIDFRTQPFDQVLARRQLASTFKPILFAAALENGFEPCHWLSNDAADLKSYEDWKPANYDGKSGGEYSFAAVLRKSLNLPSVQLYQQLGFGALNKLWQAVGFARDLPDGPAVALGAGEGSVYELAQFYAALANGGQKITPYTIESIETAQGEELYRFRGKPGEHILSDQTTDYLNAMLQQVVDSGTAVALRSKFGIQQPLAGKTGSSQDYADAWFAGYSPALVLVSRVGAAKPTIHFNSGAYGAGSALALPLFGGTMAIVQANRSMRSQFFMPFSYSYVLPVCEDYREPTLVDEFLDIFKSKPGRKAEKAAEKEQKKAERKEKRRNLFKKLLGE
jgi:penicillin-binding protein 1A